MITALSAEQVQERIYQLIPGWRDQPISHVSYLPGGYGNHNYRFTRGVDEFVLRLPGITQPYVDRTLEYQWYQRLPAGIGPQIIALDQASGAMISSWIDGRLLADLADQISPDSLVGFLRRLHRQLPDPERAYDLAQLGQTFWPQGSPYPTIQLPGSALIPCHNDLNPWNILVTDAGWITIDWEFAGNNDPLFDLVTLFLGLQRPQAELLPAAAAYLGMDTTDTSGPLQQRIHAVQRLFWLRELGWAEHQLQLGNERPEIVEQAKSAAHQLDKLYAERKS